MSELGDKREIFTKNILRLLTFIYNKGQRPRFDVEHCNHMEGSLHYKGLAKDILLFDSNNAYLKDSKDYKEAGEFWKSLHPDNCWGGDFPGDGNHFSMAFGGKK